jgi:hypothetical protein
MNIKLGDFNETVCRENIFKRTIGKESLYEISNDNGDRVVNFPTPKMLVVKTTMFIYRKIPTDTWATSEGNTHSQIDQDLIDRRRHSSILDVRSFTGADLDTEHYLVVGK